MKMTRWIPATRYSWLLFYVGFISVPAAASVQPSASPYRPNPRHWSCETTATKGLPSCDFDDDDYCGNYVGSSPNHTNYVMWKWANRTTLDSSQINIEHDWQPPGNNGTKGHFVYLDVARIDAAVGTVARMEGLVSCPGVKAVCVEFHFATFRDGDKVPAIKVYNQLQNGTEVFIGMVETDTRGQWQTARFHSSCIAKRSFIVFQSEKLSSKALVALDYISVTKSTMSCFGNETSSMTVPHVFNTTAAATTATTAPTPQSTTPHRSRDTNVIISPNICTESVDTSVQFTCQLGYKYKEVYVVNIVKDDHQQIAVMRFGSKISLKNDDLSKRFHAEGNLDNGDIGASYLKLTLPSPHFEDTGNYTCIVSYLNEEGLLEQEKISASLIVKKLDTANNESMEIVMQSLIHRMENIEALNIQQAERINELEAKLNYRSAFSAMPSAKMNYRRPMGPNMVVVFDEVTMRQGEGYDEKNGVYTAPTSGLYSFHLTLGTWSKSSTTYTDVTLQVNNVPKSILRTNNDRHVGDGYQDQNSMSLAITLNLGDKVKIVTVAGTTSGEELYGYMSTFSGYLIRSY